MKWFKKKEAMVSMETDSPEQLLAKDLYDTCMTELLNNPDLTTEDASHILLQVVEQASVGESGDEVTLDLPKFKEVFTGTLKSMGIDSTLNTQEDSMKTSKKERLGMAMGRVRATTSTVVAAAKNVSLRSAGHRVGSVAGSVASHLAKPAVSFVDGIKEGWKNGS